MINTPQFNVTPLNYSPVARRYVEAHVVKEVVVQDERNVGLRQSTPLGVKTVIVTKLLGLLVSEANSRHLAHQDRLRKRARAALFQCASGRHREEAQLGVVGCPYLFQRVCEHNRLAEVGCAGAHQRSPFEDALHRACVRGDLVQRRLHGPALKQDL